MVPLEATKTSTVGFIFLCYLKYFKLASILITKPENSKFAKFSAPSLYMQKKFKFMEKFDDMCGHFKFDGFEKKNLRMWATISQLHV